jgi:hypothetical protein
MSSHLCGQLRQEVDLISRFAESYRRKFSALIEQMNHPHDPATDQASLRLCVEAVDMILATQQHLADAITQITLPARSRARAA